MQLNEELEKLRAQQAKNIQELEYLQHDLQRLQNRLAYLEKGERQKRAHRLITKGAAIECLAPATKEMGEADFLSLMEKILALPDVLALLPKEDAE
jgi:regulator of replication initiation timing